MNNAAGELGMSGRGGGSSEEEATHKRRRGVKLWRLGLVSKEMREILMIQEADQKASVRKAPYKVGTTASPKHSVSRMLFHIDIGLLFWW